MYEARPYAGLNLWLMNYEGIAARLWDTYRATLVLDRKHSSFEDLVAALSDLGPSSITELAKQSRLPSWEGLTGRERTLWGARARVSQEIIAAAVLT